MKTESSTEIFMKRLADVQHELRHFIAAALVARPDDVMDVVQNTNYALIQHAGEYLPERPFLPWSLRFAKNQILAYRKKMAQDKLVFDDALLDLYEKSAFNDAAKAASASQQMKRLLACLGKLPERQHYLIDLHYLKGRALSHIAAEEHRPESTINMAVFRARQALYDCIQRLCRLQNTPDEPAESEKPDAFAETVVHVIDSSRPEPSEVGFLLGFLHGKPEAMGAYTAQMKVHQLLLDCTELQSAGQPPHVSPRFGRLRWKTLAVAASLTLMVGGGTIGLSRAFRTHPPATVPPAESAAVHPPRPIVEPPPAKIHTMVSVKVADHSIPPPLIPKAAPPPIHVETITPVPAKEKAPVPIQMAQSLPVKGPPSAVVATQARPLATTQSQQKENRDNMKMTTTKTAALASAMAAVTLGVGSIRAQSEDVAINTSPDRNGRWCAVTTNAIPFAWKWPTGAETAELTVIGKEKTLFSQTVTAASSSTSIVWEAFSDNIPKAEDEGIYTASLAFYGMDGAPTGTTYTAELVVTRSAFGQADVMPNDQIDRWKKIYTKTALLPYDNRWLETSNAVASASLCVSNATGICSSTALTGVEGYAEGTFNNGVHFLTTVLFDGNPETSLSAWIWKEPRGTIITFNP